MQQKKKSAFSSTKKLNRIKSEQYMPIGSLMQQIGQLKEELKGIKRGRKTDHFASTSKTAKNMENKQNRARKQLTQELTSHLSREIRLKIELLWGRLNKGLQMNDSQKVKKEVLTIIELVNNEAFQLHDQRKQLENKVHRLQIQMKEQKEEEKYWIVAQNNKRLQLEVDELKNNAYAVINEKAQQNDDIMIEYENQKIVIEELKVELQEMTKTNFQLEHLIQEWQQQCRSLQEKCTNFDKSYNAKDHQIKLLQEDVRYLRVETEKYKSQKKQFEKLWDKSSVEMRQFKRAFEEEVVKAQREKNKWMNECQLRRHQSQQLHDLESQKQLIFKELQQLRNNYSLKCKELSESKSLLHDIQRKFILVEGEHFKMSNQLQKTQRQNEYWQSQIIKLRRQFEEYTGMKRSPIKKDGRSGSKTKEDKKKALEDIHSLIRQCRTDL